VPQPTTLLGARDIHSDQKVTHITVSSIGLMHRLQDIQHLTNNVYNLTSKSNHVFETYAQNGLPVQ
jgi:hypothetical protein